LSKEKFPAIVVVMGKSDGKSSDRRDRYRRKWTEPKPVFPEMPYPAGASVTAKQIGYLAMHCRIPPVEIIARYHRGLSLAQVHLGLSHYYENQKALDAELRKDAEFNRTDSLKAPSMTLPKVRLASLMTLPEPSPEPAEKGPRKAPASPESEEAGAEQGIAAPRANRGLWGLQWARRLISRGKAPDGAPG
jgi:hypothetical protein